MKPLESLIVGSEKLTGVLGRWPVFHDAEVIEFNLWRGEVVPEEDKWQFPTATVSLWIIEHLQSADHNESHVPCIEMIVKLRFDNLDDLKLDGFNHQNAILALRIEATERGEGFPPTFVVTFQSAHGMGASFRCLGIEVLDTVRCPPTA